jgi:hypothetical protein
MDTEVSLLSCIEVFTTIVYGVMVVFWVDMRYVVDHCSDVSEKHTASMSSVIVVYVYAEVVEE